MCFPRVRRRGRAAEGGGLLNRYRVVKPYRGFESPRLRHIALILLGLNCISKVIPLSYPSRFSARTVVLRSSLGPRPISLVPSIRRLGREDQGLFVRHSHLSARASHPSKTTVHKTLRAWSCSHGSLRLGSYFQSASSPALDLGGAPMRRPFLLRQIHPSPGFAASLTSTRFLASRHDARQPHTSYSLIFLARRHLTNGVKQ
jgi:hypothetical protein